MGIPAVRALLGEERAVTLARIESMTSEFEEIVIAVAGSNGDDEHDPEGPTIAFERAQVGALLLEARAYLDDLDQALERLNLGTYGNCTQCGTPIAPERLAARPATRTCISCASGRTAIESPGPRERR
jgi:DnaK suppressor protein